VLESDWDRAKRDAEFLETAASISEHQSGSLYVTLIICSLAYQKLMEKCARAVAVNDNVLLGITKKMMTRLEDYKELICSETANLARILDPRFSNDILNDYGVLRRNVNLVCDVVDEASQKKNREGEKGGVLAKLLSEDQQPLSSPYDEISRYIQSTTIGDMSIDPLLWWKTNESRFPSIAIVARDILSVQATSVASETLFSLSGNVVSASRSSLHGESISACVLLKA